MATNERSRPSLAIAAMASFCGVAGAFAPSPSHARAAHPRIEVGTRCQQEYQNGWQTDVGNSDVWRRCGNFNSQIGQTDNVDFYFNLHGAKPVLETTNDNCGTGCGAADAVDLLYVNTHSGVNATAAFWAMWDQGQLAVTSNMRLGDNSRQLMILATFSCSTLLTSDGNVWTRWFPPFAGGLVMTLGGHDLLYSGNDQSATEFASRMQDGEPIGQAWLESTWYADNRNAPAAMFVGANADDCGRRGGTTLPSLYSTPILRDSAIGYMCWSTWN